MDLQKLDSCASASSYYDSSISTEEPFSSPLDRKIAPCQVSRRVKTERKPFRLPKITDPTVTRPIYISNTSSLNYKGSISIQHTTLARGTRLIPSLSYSNDLSPESRFLWAIASHQPIYLLRSIGYHITDLGKQRAFGRHPDPDLPTPLEACIIYGNLVALEYLVEDVAEHNFSVSKRLSYQDMDKLVALAVECRQDDVLLYLFQECAMWKYSPQACIFNLAETCLVKCLEWRLENLEKRNALLGWRRHTSLLACLSKAVEINSSYHDFHAKQQARLETVEMLLRAGGKNMMRDAEFLRILLQALVLARVKEAEALFSAWEANGPWSNLNRELVSQIYLSASGRPETRSMAEALVADYSWLAPRLGLQVDDDGLVLRDDEVETETLSCAEFEEHGDNDEDTDSMVADLIRELDLHIDDRE